MECPKYENTAFRARIVADNSANDVQLVRLVLRRGIMLSQLLGRYLLAITYIISLKVGVSLGVDIFLTNAKQYHMLYLHNMGITLED